MKKIMSICLIGTMCLLVGCKSNETPPPGVVQSPPEEEVGTEADETENQSKLYIGMDGAFTEYDVSGDFEEYDGSEDVSDYLEELIDQIGTLTGWDLDCDISAYKTIGVAFENDGTLFVGPPEQQKEEFHMYDANQTVGTILDSVKKTIQMNLGTENPDLIEVYFCTEDEKELIFSDIKMYVPMEEAYTGLVPIKE